MRLDEERDDGTSPGLREATKNSYADRNGQSSSKAHSTRPRGPARSVQAQPDAAWRDDMESVCKHELELHNIEVHQRIVRSMPTAAVSCARTT